ncbi:MAG TPA: hypothetical protein VF727_04660 [Allosphingosinicella sp.]
MTMKALLIVTVLLATPAIASPQADKSSDSDRLVCRMVAETGSRLSRSRVCLTKEQWEEQRAENRRTVERSQANRPMNGQ